MLIDHQWDFEPGPARLRRVEVRPNWARRVVLRLLGMRAHYQVEYRLVVEAREGRGGRR